MNRVVLVCGPPGAGKNHYVARVFQKGDLIVDYDRIMQALSDQALHEGVRSLHFFAWAAVEAIYNRLSLHRESVTAWVIACAPGKHKRDELARKLRTLEVVVLDTPEDVCAARLIERGMASESVHQWFASEQAGGRDTNDVHSILAASRALPISEARVSGA